MHSIGKDTTIHTPSNLYGDYKIGNNCMVGAFVEIQPDVVIGNNCRIQSHSFICSKVRMGENCFIGHGVMTINDWNPPGGKDNWKSLIIGNNVMIGSNATIFPVKIGDGAKIGAGVVLKRDVEPGEIVK